MCCPVQMPVHKRSILGRPSRARLCCLPPSTLFCVSSKVFGKSLHIVVDSSNKIQLQFNYYMLYCGINLRHPSSRLLCLEHVAKLAIALSKKQQLWTQLPIMQRDCGVNMFLSSCITIAHQCILVVSCYFDCLVRTVDVGCSSCYIVGLESQNVRILTQAVFVPRSLAASLSVSQCNLRPPCRSDNRRFHNINLTIVNETASIHTG